MASEQLVSLETRDEVTLITMDDGKANALSPELIAGLRSALKEGGQARAIVLAGRNGYFSGGLDLSVVKSDDRARVDGLMEEAIQLFRDMMTTECPIVAACTGHAVAGGAMLLMCSDLRIGEAGESKIGLIEAAVGVPLSEFGISVASLRLNRRHFVRATTLAYVTGPHDAVATGFLDEVVDDHVVDAALGRAHELASRLDPKAFASSKRLAYASVLAGNRARVDRA